MKMFIAGSIVAVVAMTGVAAEAQEPLPASAAQRALEAGQYDQAVQQVNEARERGETGLVDAFVAAHANMRRSQNDAAKAEFARLIESEDETWRRVGESSTALVDGDLDHAQAVAEAAVAQINERQAQPDAPAPDEAGRWRDFAAFYQLGLVKSRREDWAGAADALDRATQLNPSFAYAHYYAGLAASRLKRSDQVAAHFEVFLKLAPTAPERGAVMSIMRTLRGA